MHDCLAQEASSVQLVDIRQRTANKAHKCLECGNAIEVGDQYFYGFWIYTDNSTANAHICRSCDRDWEIVNSILDIPIVYGCLTQALKCSEGNVVDRLNDALFDELFCEEPAVLDISHVVLRRLGKEFYIEWLQCQLEIDEPEDVEYDDGFLAGLLKTEFTALQETGHHQPILSIIDRFLGRAALRETLLAHGVATEEVLDTVLSAPTLDSPGQQLLFSANPTSEEAAWSTSS